MRIWGDDMATTVLGLKTFAASDPVDYNEINDNYTKIDNGVKTAMQGRAAHNLLDNSDFRNPVNQRGKTSYSASVYTIDRWNLYDPNGDGTVAINNGYISLTGGSGVVSLSCRFAKGFLDANKTYTARVCDNLGNINPAGMNFYDSFDAFEISAGAGETKNVVWAALYEGSYDASTLPAYKPKGYAAELAECQRYYRRFDEVAFGSFITANALQVDMALDPPMRIAPTVTSITSPTAYTVNGKLDISGSYASTSSKTKAGYVYYSPTAVPVGTPAVVSGMIAELSADL